MALNINDMQPNERDEVWYGGQLVGMSPERAAIVRAILAQQDAANDYGIGGQTSSGNTGDPGTGATGPGGVTSGGTGYGAGAPGPGMGIGRGANEMSSFDPMGGGAMTTANASMVGAPVGNLFDPGALPSAGVLPESGNSLVSQG